LTYKYSCSINSNYVCGTFKGFTAVANWKSAGSSDTSTQWTTAFSTPEGKELLTPERLVIVAPPLALLSIVADQIARYGLPIAVAAQNLDKPMEGVKHTGEGYIPKIIKELAKYVILGHTETRRDRDLDEDDINKLLDYAREYNLETIVCVANLEQAAEIKRHDLNFPGIIAYEPPTAIRTGAAANPSEANDICRSIKKLYPNASVIYGGSVDAKNVNEFLIQNTISGVLVGDKSSNFSFFQDILRSSPRQATLNFRD
jgi:triosephosphate isomerase (TIM)